MRPEARKTGGKVEKVMREFRSGSLRSSSGQKVTNPKQAIAIGLSEQRRMKKYANGGGVTPEEMVERKRVEDVARRAREEAERMKSPTPTPAEKDKMKKQLQSPIKYARGGAIAKQDTRHGSMDMPFKGLKKFTGMKSGGVTKRYAEGGEVTDDLDQMTFREAFKTARDEKGAGQTFTWRGKKYTTDYASDKPAAKVTDYGDEASRMASRAPAPRTEMKPIPSGETNRGAVTGRASPLAAKARSNEEKEATAKRLPGAVLEGALTAGAAASGLGALSRAPAALRAMREAGPRAKAAMEKAAEGTARSKMSRGEANPRGWENMSLEEKARVGGYRKGGSVESKGMMKKEVAFMKAKGAPKSMLKHEMAEMKGAKYARGGGVESRGKTRGTVIKMASGGSVRGGGCEQRGKTRGKMI